MRAEYPERRRVAARVAEVKSEQALTRFRKLGLQSANRIMSTMQCVVPQLHSTPGCHSPSPVVCTDTQITWR